jgi:hypothetical protein
MRIIGLLRFIISALVLAIGIPAASADNDNPYRESFKLLLLEESLGHPDRVKIAQGIGGFCRSLADAIPTLSPREQEWLDTELEASGQRFSAALSSPEASKSVTSRAANNCATLAEALRERLASDTESARRSEAVLWAYLAVELLSQNFEMHIDNLTSRGIVRFDKVHETSIQLMPRAGIGIVEKILAVHLANEAAK